MATERQAEHGTTREYSRGCRCEACRSAQSAHRRAYYLAHYEQERAVGKAYYQANREECLVRSAECDKRNRVKRNAAQRAKYALDPSKSRKATLAFLAKEKITNPERAVERNRRWSRTPHGKASNSVRNQARRNATMDEWTTEYIAILHGDPCVFCGGSFAEIDHIVAVAKGGTSEHDNLAPTCMSCNRSKQALDLVPFLLQRVS